ncbi:hypothetical protein NEMIN01_1951 [Nematocida minor]|uniref:uncharacterized protein n=1 Tax=Nematocida minor TaxID=1912983 RepID=UPI00221E9214|nr:uncharacterized protein NEMIN01_1951 [Nematocida minor]KAI5192337.1 hypothetical protein NEMIN01_1951 [Nematocida minor]
MLNIYQILVQSLNSEVCVRYVHNKEIKTATGILHSLDEHLNIALRADNAVTIFYTKYIIECIVSKSTEHSK